MTKKGNRYIVRWTGKASEWRVTLKVGKTKAGATVKGSLHSHTFTLPRAKGAASARVTAR